VPEPGILVGVAGAAGVFVVGVVGVFVVGCRVGFDGCVGVGVAICLGMTIGVGVGCFSMCMLSAISDWDGEIWLSGFEAQALKRAIISNPSKKYDCLLMRYPSFLPSAVSPGRKIITRTFRETCRKEEFA
jgi:hypothetical protein